MSGRPKKIQTPEILLNHFEAYKKATKAKPFIVGDWVGARALSVKRTKERPLTMEGFENYCESKNLISDLGRYFTNSDGAYDTFRAICSRIRREIRQDQIEGGMAGVYNPSITQRLNNLVEKVEQTNIEQPLFPDK